MIKENKSEVQYFDDLFAIVAEYKLNVNFYI